MPSPGSRESHEGVLENHNGLSPSPEARRETQGSLVSRERLMPSPGSRESHEGVLENHNGLSPSPEARRKTQGSLVSREEPGMSLSEPQETQDESRSKGERLT